MVELLQIRRYPYLIVILSVVIAYGVVAVTFAIGQWDPSARVFSTDSTALVDLDSGEVVSLYFADAESFLVRSDVMAASYVCEAQYGDMGNKVKLDSGNGSRRVTLWGKHLAVARFTAPRSGLYRITCEPKYAPHVKLLLAKPPLFSVGAQTSLLSPVLALVVGCLTIMAVGVWIALRFVTRRAPRTQTSR